MKRTISLLLALLFVLALAPAVLADVILEPQDGFYNQHREECEYHNRAYLASGPAGTVTVYATPESPAVEQKLENGTEIWITWLYTGKDGISWGFCEYFDEDHWAGWMPMDHLLLKYDSIAFQEEFAARIVESSGQIIPEADGRIHFWGYPGSDTLWAHMAVDTQYRPEYHLTFTDDAGRTWGCVGYYAGLRNTWVCLDDPTADYDKLYAENPPQQVTHPTKDGTPVEIKPAGPNMRVVVLAVCAVAAVSGGFLFATRKKK